MTLYEQRLSEDLQVIRVAVQDISDRVCAALEQAVTAIAENDAETLYRVVMDDYGINRDIRCIDKRCHEFVARHLPAAGHLRFISSVLRMTIALERAGDYAVTISRVVLQLSKPLSKPAVEKLQPMAELSVSMLGDATQAFLSGDAELADRTRKLDYRVDKAYDEFFDVLMEDGKNRTPRELVSLLKVFSKVERFSDQAKNICEEAIFSATGKMKAPKVFRILFVDETNDLASQLAVAIARKAFAKSGVYTSAGWSPAKQIHPTLEKVAERFGFDVSRVRPTKLAEFASFPTEYHLVVAFDLKDEGVLPAIPYHTILLKWNLAENTTNTDELIRDLTSRITNLIERLRGKDAD